MLMIEQHRALSFLVGYYRGALDTIRKDPSLVAPAFLEKIKFALDDTAKTFEEVRKLPSDWNNQREAEERDITRMKIQDHILQTQVTLPSWPNGVQWSNYSWTRDKFNKVLFITERW